MGCAHVSLGTCVSHTERAQLLQPTALGFDLTQALNRLSALNVSRQLCLCLVAISQLHSGMLCSLPTPYAAAPAVLGDAQS